MNEQTERVSLISRLTATGVFKANDKRAMRDMSLNTLRELARAVNGDRLPEVRLHTSVKGAERGTLIERLISSGVFQPNDQNALWLLSSETLSKLAALKPNSRREDPTAREMLPPSLGDIVRGH
jgi:hypothetical protein